MKTIKTRRKRIRTVEIVATARGNVHFGCAQRASLRTPGKARAFSVFKLKSRSNPGTEPKAAAQNVFGLQQTNGFCLLAFVDVSEATVRLKN